MNEPQGTSDDIEISKRARISLDIKALTRGRELKTGWLARPRALLIIFGHIAASVALGQSDAIDLRTEFSQVYARYEAALSASDFDGAAALAEYALELGLQLYGEFDLNTASLTKNHAFTLEQLGFAYEAEAEYLTALNILDTLQAADSLAAVPILTRLGGLYQGGRRQAEYLQRALAIQRADAPNDMLAYASLAVEAANILTRTSFGRPLAREILLPVLDELEGLFGEDSPRLVPVLIALSKADAQFRNDEHQLRWVERAIEIVEDAYQEEDSVKADIELEVGSDLLNMSKSPRSEPYLEDALSFFQGSLGAYDQRTAVTAMLLGEARVEGSSYASAERPLLDALQFFADKPSFQAQEIRIRTMLVETYMLMDKPDEATPHLVELGILSRDSKPFEYLPMYKRLPAYPARAAMRGLEGYVIVQYTVTTTGQTDEISVIESTSNLFDRAVVDSVRRYRYIPQVLDGGPVEVPGITTRIDFRLDREQ